MTVSPQRTPKGRLRAGSGSYLPCPSLRSAPLALLSQLEARRGRGGVVGGKEGLERSFALTGMLWNPRLWREPPPFLPSLLPQLPNVTGARLRTQKPGLPGAPADHQSIVLCSAQELAVVLCWGLWDSGLRTLKTAQRAKTLFETNHLRSCWPFGKLLLEGASLM